MILKYWSTSPESSKRNASALVVHLGRALLPELGQTFRYANFATTTSLHEAERMLAISREMLADYPFVRLEHLRPSLGVGFPKPPHAHKLVWLLQRWDAQASELPQVLDVSRSDLNAGLYDRLMPEKAT